ncbi:MAG: hypothetical protein AAGJ81_04130 [Verrucomicrobiota bacterium]
MKLFFTVLFASVFFLSVHAETDLIKISIRVEEGGGILSSPRLTMKSGKEGRMEVTQEFHQDAQLSLPVGVIADMFAVLKENKISYSVLLVLREHVSSEGNVTEQAVTSFKTREFMLSGVTRSGDEVEVRVDPETVVTMYLEKVSPPEKKPRVAQ